jgi:hypothetical protein
MNESGTNAIEAAISPDSLAIFNTRDLSESLQMEIVMSMRHYAIHFFAINEANPIPPQFVGSGTLVGLDGKDFILTAEHVWSAVCSGERIGLDYKSERLMDAIPKSYFDAFVPHDRETDEWGPDLALIPLPLTLSSAIKRDKVFLDLQKVVDRCDAPLEPERGLWFLLGAPGELGKFEKDNAVLKIMGFFGAGPETHETHLRDGFDYFDTSVNRREIQGLPKSHGGVSGGGLWRTQIIRDRTGEIRWDGTRELMGVAFYQENPPGEVGFVRAHGCQSIRRLVVEYRAAHS